VSTEEEFMNKAMKVKSDDNRKWSRTNAGPPRLKQAYGDFFREFPWQLYVTLTFSRDISNNQADAILDRFIDDMEQRIRAPLSVLIGKERGNYSGCGRPSIRIHFHLLLECAYPVDARLLADVWKKPEYGGERTQGPGAWVVPYDPKLDAASYVMKGITDPNCDWSFRNLDLISPKTPASYATSAKMRSRLKRHRRRQHLAISTQAPSISSLPTVCPPETLEKARRQPGPARRCRRRQ
jgi:hypothetical protein